MASIDITEIEISVNQALIDRVEKLEELVRQHEEWRKSYPGRQLLSICQNALENVSGGSDTIAAVNRKTISDYIDAVWQWLEAGNVEGDNAAGIALVMRNARGRDCRTRGILKQC